MKKRELAQKRNWNKFILMGTQIGRLNDTALVEEEIEIINTIKSLLNYLNDRWESNILDLGLNVNLYKVIDKLDNSVRLCKENDVSLYKKDGGFIVKKLTKNEIRDR